MILAGDSETSHWNRTRLTVHLQRSPRVYHPSMFYRVALVILGVLVLASSANALPLRVDFSGTVDQLDSLNAESLPAELGASIAVDAPVSGFFAVDDSSADEPNLEFPSGTFEMRLGDIAITVHSAFFNVVPETNAFVEGPVVQVSATGSLPEIPAVARVNVGLGFSYFGLPPLPSTRLADVPWEDLSDRQVSGFSLQILDAAGGAVDIRGRIDFVSSTVPEPGAGALLIAATLASGFALSRRARLT